MRENGRIKERQATAHKMMAMLNGPASFVLRPYAASLATRMHPWTAS